MYRSYWSSSTPRSYGYPNYGYGYSSNRSSLYNTNRFNVDYSNSPYWNEYYYGRSRRIPYSWERDDERNRRRRRGRRTRSRRSPENVPEPRPPSPRTPSPPPVTTPKPKPPKEELVKVLNVDDIDFLIEENTKKHRTDVYECTEAGRKDKEGNPLPAELVVRRGDSIKIKIKFDRPFDLKKNDCKIGFSIGKDNTETQGTKVEFEVDETGKTKYKPDQWGATLLSKKDNEITAEIHIPANCIVGEWNMYVKSLSMGKDKSGKEQILDIIYDHNIDITILFNPWCKDDGVYMATEDLSYEYILNESGAVWRGNAWSPSPKSWNFGQFQLGVLDAALSLLRNGFNKPNSRAMSDPVKVSRAIVKMVNSQDDKGVLVGNWTGDYEGGVSPSKWVGSVKILRQYMETGEPVMYGQCWVFSCITTTVCRALGIPCRTVTNFSSAHDTDGSNTIDKFFVRDKDGKLEKSYMPGSSDSVWNFHVWNEVWLARPDLDAKGFDGWQVVDATPQETSDGVYTCGPCPVSAVKKGMCNIGYDTPFVFAEVNADEIHWKKKWGQLKRIGFYNTKVGQNISTKKPIDPPVDGVHDYDRIVRMDLTHEYKFREGSAEEREAVQMAYKTAANPRKNVYNNEVEIQPVLFTLVHSNNVFIGEELSLELKADNKEKKGSRQVLVDIVLAPKTYTGETGKEFFKENFKSQEIESGNSGSFKVVVKPAKYMPYLIEQANVLIEARITVPKNQESPEFTVVKSHDFRFRRPDLDVTGPKSGKVGEAVKFEVSFTNPMTNALTKCDISMESTGFNDTEDEKVPDVPENGLFKKVFTLVPRKKGKHTVNFSFDCKELKDISGSATIKIKKT